MDIIFEVRVRFEATLWVPWALVAGCAPEAGTGVAGPRIRPEITVEVAERSATVLRVSWPALEDDATLTLVSDDGTELRRAPVASGATEALLLGFLPDTELVVSLEAELDGETQRSDEVWVQTGPVPGALPAFTTFHSDPEALAGGLVLTTAVGEPGAALILDVEGAPVWWRVLEDSPGTWQPRAHLAPDGRSVVIGQMQGPAVMVLYRFAMDGEELSRTTVPGAHHDFTMLPDGTIAVLVAVQRETEQGPVLIDEIQEIALDGSIRTVWTVTDDIAYDPSLGIPNDPTSWSHANFIQYEPEQDAYLVSLLALASAVLVDRGSGRSVWTVGGVGSGFVRVGGELFWTKHGMDLAEDSLLVFENTWDEGVSAVQQYALDPAAGLARPTWTWAPEPSIMAMTLGDVHRLADGTTLVAFGAAGRIDQVDPTGSPLFSVGTALGDPLGYAQVIPPLPAALSVPR